MAAAVETKSDESIIMMQSIAVGAEEPLANNDMVCEELASRCKGIKKVAGDEHETHKIKMERLDNFKARAVLLVKEAIKPSKRVKWLISGVWISGEVPYDQVAEETILQPQQDMIIRERALNLGCQAVQTQLVTKILEKAMMCATHAGRTEIIQEDTELAKRFCSVKGGK